MRLADIKGDKAFDVLADLLDPIGVMAVDNEIKEAAEVNYLKAVQVALRKHPKELKDILAILSLENPETFEVSLATLPRLVIELVNDPDVRVLFQSQSQDNTSSGSAMENTKESEK